MLTLRVYSQMSIPCCTEGGLALACLRGDVSVQALRVTAVDLPDNQNRSTRERSERDSDGGSRARRASASF
jgi:hypothetical protein